VYIAFIGVTLTGSPVRENSDQLSFENSVVFFYCCNDVSLNDLQFENMPVNLQNEQKCFDMLKSCLVIF